MRHYFLLLTLTAAFSSCSGGDKNREDFPDTYQKGEKESNALIRDQNIRDTMTTPDTTPGVIKPAGQ